MAHAADEPRWLHADEHLIVAVKPAGLLAVPGRGPDKADCVWQRALARWPDALVVHRLDQATSGLMLLARGPAMQRALGKAFEAREVDKRYEAIVHGQPAGGAGRIEGPIAMDWPHRPRRRIDSAAGRPSRTDWHCLTAQGSTTRLALHPITGRTHQLRVHLASIGHPIVGDRLYGPEDDSAPRLMLHARSLHLRHPASGEPVAFEDPPPF